MENNEICLVPQVLITCIPNMNKRGWLGKIGNEHRTEIYLELINKLSLLKHVRLAFNYLVNGVHRMKLT